MRRGNHGMAPSASTPLTSPHSPAAPNDLAAAVVAIRMHAHDMNVCVAAAAAAAAKEEEQGFACVLWLFLLFEKE